MDDPSTPAKEGDLVSGTLLTLMVGGGQKRAANLTGRKQPYVKIVFNKKSSVFTNKKLISKYSYSSVTLNLKIWGYSEHSENVLISNVDAPIHYVAVSWPNPLTSPSSR